MRLSHPIYLILLSALLLGCSQRDAMLLPVSLSCEYLEDPQNIDIAAPDLSWQLEPVSADIKNLKQTACQIICASSLEKLNANNGDIWKTGKMNSSSSQQIEYKGRELKSFENCYWKVRIWDQDGKRSEWSTPAQWKMAVMNASLWNKATWIGLEEDTREKGLKKRIRERSRHGIDSVEAHPSPLIRKELILKKELESAFIYISGLGYNEVYINGKKTDGSQTATIMALDFGLVPDSAKQKVIEGLVYDIVENHNKHHSTGIHGHRPYYSVLTNLGLDQLAYDVLTNPTFPSQAYIVNAGLTTWPERQWEWASGIEWDRSLNHPMQAGFAAFFYENILGIKPDSQIPGFRNIIMKPHFIHQLEWAKGHHSSPFGKISSSWRKHEKTIYWEIFIPPGCTAKIHLPANDITVVKESGIALNRHTNPGSVVKNGKYFILDVGSGNYKFETVIQ